MFFRLTNSPAMFQTMMNTIFHNLIVDSSMKVYMDDIAIPIAKQPTETETKHIDRHRSIVNQVLQKLNDHDLYLNLEKCNFELPHIDFLEV